MDNLVIVLGRSDLLVLNALIWFNVQLWNTSQLQILSSVTFQTLSFIKSKVVTPSGESQLLELMNILKVQQNQLEENQKQLQKLSDQVLKSKSDTDDKIFKKKQRS